MQANIELQIDQLNLYGFSKKDVFYIGKAVEEELIKLIEQGGLSEKISTNTFLKSLEGKSFDFSPSSRPETIGKQIAKSIYDSISFKK